MDIHANCPTHRERAGEVSAAWTNSRDTDHANVSDPSVPRILAKVVAIFPQISQSQD